MFVLGVIEKSLYSTDILDELAYFRIGETFEEIHNDPHPVRRMNKYQIPEKELSRILPLLEKRLRPEWYLYAYDEDYVYVILSGKSFKLTQHKDILWKEMVEYGVSMGVNRMYLENFTVTA